VGAGDCAHGVEPSRSTKCGEFLTKNSVPGFSEFYLVTMKCQVSTDTHKCGNVGSLGYILARSQLKLKKFAHCFRHTCQFVSPFVTIGEMLQGFV
jgi:hypothetical protein